MKESQWNSNSTTGIKVVLNSVSNFSKAAALV